jgi:two-component system, NtrC family, response regulator AtoC
MVPRILVVDDDRDMGDVIAAELGEMGFAVACEVSGEAALDRLRAGDFDTVVTDLNMRGMNGIDLCDRIVAARPDVPVVVITAFGSLETAIAAIRAGAYDFITKPFDMEALAIAVRRAVERRSLRDEVRRLREVVAGPREGDPLIGESPAMSSLRAWVERVADTDASVLITGESGTGKELLARALHERSRRAKGPFVAINCAAVPETLLESELFGHARGAFTDAKAARSGLFAQAERGTLFLDEIGEMPVSMQAKLLRALQDRTVRPVGGDKEVPFDARIVSATSRDLESAVVEGRFREDLLYRIDVIHVEVPPLRSRGRDVLLLAQRFVDRAAQKASKGVRGISAEAAQRLMDYSWPGNVRELENCIERATVLTSFELISVDDLPQRVRDYAPRHVLVAGEDPSELVTLEEVEHRYIERVLQAVGGNKLQASRILGIDRTTLYRKLDRGKRQR